MKLIVELIYERKAITSLCETIEKRLNQIEKLITQNLMIKK